MIDHATQKLYIGIDAGGTKTDVHWRYLDASGRFEDDGANATRDGIDQVVATFAGCIEEVVARSSRSAQQPPHTIEICAGVAGAGSLDVRELLEAQLAGMLGSRLGPEVQVLVRVVTDAELALFAAHGLGPGAVVVLGTGSIALLKTPDGRVVVRGGLGYLLGDEGSGYALGRAAARYAARHTEQGERSALAQALLDALGAVDRESLIRIVYRERFALQQLAPILLEFADRGDVDAVRIVGAEADEVRHLVEALDDSRGEDRPPLSVCLFGGLTAHRYYRNVIEDLVPPSWSLVEPKEDILSVAAVQLLHLEARNY